MFGSFNIGVNIYLKLKGLFGCSVRHMWLEHSAFKSKFIVSHMILLLSQYIVFLQYYLK